MNFYLLLVELIEKIGGRMPVSYIALPDGVDPGALTPATYSQHIDLSRLYGMVY